MQAILDERMALSEAISGIRRIVESYPHGGRDAGKSYIGALASTLCAYPKAVAEQCCDLRHGIVTEREFLPSVAHVVVWCEAHTAPLRRQWDAAARRQSQLLAREEFQAEQGIGRTCKLSYGELKARFGDWHDEWRPLGQRATEAAAAARAALVGQIGEETFAALPDAKR